MSNRSYKRGEGFRDQRLFLVVTEGINDEPRYFRNLCHDSKRVVAAYLEPEANKSAPGFIHDRITAYLADDSRGDKPDFVCVVIDRDRFKEETLQALASDCAQFGWTFAFSNPCFQLWLLLHNSEPEQVFNNCGELKPLVGAKTFGVYNDPNQRKQLMQDVKQAIMRAQKLDSNPNNPLPPANCTRVYLVAQQMLAHMESKAKH